VNAEFDLRQAGPQTWDIEVASDRGSLRLSRGGNGLELDGDAQDVGEEAEYRASTSASPSSSVRVGARSIWLRCAWPKKP
jgi:D-galactose 1-dehydrogenase